MDRVHLDVFASFYHCLIENANAADVCGPINWLQIRATELCVLCLCVSVAVDEYGDKKLTCFFRVACLRALDSQNAI